LTVTIRISGAPAGGHAIPTMESGFMEDHRRLPMSYPLLPSWEFLTRNPNPIPSLHLQVYPANFNIIFKNSKNQLTLYRGRLFKLPTNPESKILFKEIIT
jgi:hypothetical protein